MSFLNDLKVAVINKDIEKLKKLSDVSPGFSSVEEANEILNYIIEAKKILENEKASLSSQMKDIKKLQKFYTSKKESGFDFKI
jgi:hypothetical protein